MKYPQDFIRYSSVAKYLQCPRQWYHDYVLLKDAPDRENFIFFQGTRYHEALRVLFSSGSLEKALLEIEPYKEGRKKFQADQLSNISTLVRNYYDQVYPKYANRVQEVEVTTKVEVPGIPIPLRSTIDIYTIDGTIIDHKTVGYQKPNISNSLQLSLYSYVYYKIHHTLPRKIEYHYAMKNTGEVEVVENTVSNEDVLKAVSTVRSVYKAIENDIFPVSYDCRFCTHDAICELDTNII